MKGCGRRCSAKISKDQITGAACPQRSRLLPIPVPPSLGGWGLAFILTVPKGCQSSSHHMHVSHWTPTLAFQTQCSQNTSTPPNQFSPLFSSSPFHWTKETEKEK